MLGTTPVNTQAPADRLMCPTCGNQGELSVSQPVGAFGAGSRSSIGARAARVLDRVDYVITLARLRVLDCVCGPVPLTPAHGRRERDRR
jgi:hypothetical protein